MPRIGSRSEYNSQRFSTSYGFEVGRISAGAALEGLRVADFSRVLAGPYATMMLADLGADVIKIESPDGDDTRSWTPPVDQDGRGTYFSSVNRNKRSIVFDLKTDEGLAEAKRLALSADVVVENFRSGTMEKFGLGYDELAHSNPGLVYCSITGFGHGAGAELPGYDLLVQALGGLMSITGEEQGEPTKVGVALVDVLTGLHAVVGIQAALAARSQAGLGQRVDVNLLSSLLSALVNQASSTITTGLAPTRLGNAHPSIAPYETFRALDRTLVIAVGNDRQFSSLLRVLDATDLSDDERFSTNDRRVAHRGELRSVLDERLSIASAAHWLGRLKAEGVPAGPVNSVAEAFELAEQLGLGSVVELASSGRTSAQVASPLRLSHTPPQYLSVPPDLGEHSGASWRNDERQ